MIARLLQSLRQSRACAIAFTVFIATFWLNQGASGKDWEAFRQQTLAEPGSHVFDLVRYPFAFLYRRAPDEAIYFETASAVLGLPYERAVLEARGYSPLPPIATPSDGRFHAPYAEVPFEYPPPNVPFVIAPRVVTSSFIAYARVLGAILGLMLVASALIAARLGSRESGDSGESRDETGRIYAFGLLLVAHGSIAIQRLDAIVALLAILMVRAAIRKDDRALGFWGGLVTAAKLVPVLLLPAIVIASGIRGTKRLGAVALGAGLGLAIGLGPMLVLGRETLPLLLTYHSARGLHAESSLGVVYGAVKVVLGMREAATLDFGSYNFHGATSGVLAKLTAPLTLVLAGVAMHATHRGRAAIDDAAGKTAEEDRACRIVLATLATMTALWLGAKVFSPQYLTWALPLVIAVPGRLWKRVASGFALVLLLSQMYLRGYFDHVYNQWPAGVVTMIVRLAVLTAFFVMLLQRLRARPVPCP